MIDQLLTDEEKTQQMEYYNLNNGMLGEEIIDHRLSKSNELWRMAKTRNWTQEHKSHDGNMTYKIGVEDGKRMMQITQENVEQIRAEAKEKRDFYREHEEAWRIMFPHANYPAMHLPQCYDFEIASKYFGGMRWDGVKNDPYMKQQYYKVVNAYYSDFVIHPSGKIPVGDHVKFPSLKRH